MNSSREEGIWVVSKSKAIRRGRGRLGGKQVLIRETTGNRMDGGTNQVMAVKDSREDNQRNQITEES